MKKRLTKQERNDILRKKVKKLKKQKAKTENFINIPFKNKIISERAVLTFLSVGITFFITFNAYASINTDLNAITKATADSVYIFNQPAVAVNLKAVSAVNNKLPVNKSIKDEKTLEIENKISPIIKGTPMEEMKGEILKRDKRVAAFLVGIAMKESKFGKYSPKKNGADCFNYWGYRGRENPTASGYSCFDSPEHAIKVVGDRIESMVKRGAKTPADMISWKCGSTCAGHDPASVKKWITDVAIHYYQINSEIEIARK